MKNDLQLALENRVYKHVTYVIFIYLDAFVALPAFRLSIFSLRLNQVHKQQYGTLKIK